MNRIFWYDLIANIYDFFTILPYQKLRREAIFQLQIERGDTVVELGCGTGLNLRELSLSVGKDGVVVAVEPSRAMLQKAKEKSGKYHLENVIFRENNISEYLGGRDFPEHKTPHLKVISVLVISVIPEWKQDIAAIVQALPGGSAFLVMDLYSEKRNLFARIIDRLATSEIGRKPWVFMEENLSDFKISWHNVPFFFGVKAFVARGVKNG